VRYSAGLTLQERDLVEFPEKLSRDVTGAPIPSAARLVERGQTGAEAASLIMQACIGSR